MQGFRTMDSSAALLPRSRTEVGGWVLLGQSTGIIQESMSLTSSFCMRRNSGKVRDSLSKASHQVNRESTPFHLFQALTYLIPQ